MFAAFCPQPSSLPVSTVLTYTILYLVARKSFLKPLPGQPWPLPFLAVFRVLPGSAHPAGNQYSQLGVGGYGRRGPRNCGTRQSNRGRRGSPQVATSGLPGPSLLDEARLMVWRRDGAEKASASNQAVVLHLVIALLARRAALPAPPSPRPVCALCLAPQPQGPEWEGRRRRNE